MGMIQANQIIIGPNEIHFIYSQILCFPYFNF